MNKAQKDFAILFTTLLLLGFIIFNWNNVSWAFNYRVMSNLTYKFFNPYENSYLLMGTKKQLADNTNNSVDTENNYIEIPSLGITAPVNRGAGINADILENQLDSGVVIYPESALPGEKGQTIILGHSAPPNWPKIKYDWVFSDINELKNGDKIIVNFNGRQFSYSVKNKSIIQKGQEIKPGANINEKSLVLISCWPPGKNYQRIAVEAEMTE